MQSVALKGTNAGYELIIKESASIREILTDLSQLLAKLVQQIDNSDENITLNIQMGNRLLPKDVRESITSLVNKYDCLTLGGFLSNIITKEESARQLAEQNIEVMSRTIRNGQEVKVEGDVLFFGTIHEGGKLLATGNIFNMGTIGGIVQSGFPDDESKLIIGDLHTAQQVRIAEQYDVVDDKPVDSSNKTVIYVNDLHVLSYGKLKNLKEINPKFFNRIGGIE